ncbi:MAG TPA: aspartate aminotransferase family protein [Gaiellaceae bacterium]|nr:aspartate aminotransferase family protein [Gaiellaceae bacterium]
MRADETARAARLAYEEASAWLAGLDERPVLPAGADEAVARFDGPLPEEGAGAEPALRELAGGLDGATASPGPRFFHFVTGGVTPAALGADWLATALDQNAFSRVGSPLGTRLETVALRWLRELFELPAEWGGALSTGATTANLMGLAAARQWWGERHGRDVGADGLAGLPAVPVLSSGFVHPSALKALAVLGIGRGSVRTFSRDGAGRLDLPALRAALEELRGAPAILIGNAGEVNAGEFDPIGELADLADEHGAWLHVDGAFGLFARVSPRSAHLGEGIERADSVIADGHKWLNVPYDCGFAFVRDAGLLAKVFSLAAAYLPGDEPEPTYGYLTAESSQRARALAVWAALRAWGRAGYREMVERHLDLAQRLAARVDAAPDLERLADVPLCIVCFRFRPEGVPEEELNGLNARLGEAILADGRVYVGTTSFDGKTALRPAIVNWRTREEDVDLLADVVRELGAALAGTRTK